MKKQIRILKSIFATSFMGLATYLIYSRLYFPKAGLSEGLFGILFSIPGVVLLFSQPIWSLLTDYSGSTKTNFQIMLIGSGVFLLIFYFAKDFFLNNFIALAILMGIFSLFYTARGPVRNSLALEFTGDSDEGFGKVRLWASVGWSFAAIVVGYFLYITSLELLFPIAAIFFILAGIQATFLETPPKKTLKTLNIFKNKDIRKALENRELWIFLIFLFILWVGINGVTIFLPMYLESHFGMNLFWMGAFYAFLSLVEVPFFYHDEKISYSIGIRNFLITGFGVLSITWILFGLVESPYLGLVVLALRGIGYSFVYSGSVSYIDMEVTENTRTVGQSLFTMIAFGISAIVGRTVWGFLAEIISLQYLYILGGFLGLIATLGLILFWSLTHN